MSYCPKNNLLNLLRRGSKFFRKASNSAAPTAAPTSTPGQASSSAAAISLTLANDASLEVAQLPTPQPHMHHVQS